MSQTIAGLPKWLENGHNVPHISLVLGTLAKRERIRANARTASKHAANPSLRHRLVHIAPNLLNKADHVSHYSISVGVQPDNLPWNRYSDVVPYDRTRVVVCPPGSSVEVLEDGRYLNANWVRELAGGKWWVAAQAPLPQTAHAFLSVLLEPTSSPPPHATASTSPGPSAQPTFSKSRIRTIVQLTPNFESGMRKAHIYFPAVEGDSWDVDPEPGRADPLRVTLVRARKIEGAHCVQSTVSVQLLSPAHAPVGEPAVFQHLLYAAWPDHGVPAREDRDSLLHFAKLVDETNHDPEGNGAGEGGEDDPPVMVNCSAGIGRTGAFIAICSLLRKYRFLRPLKAPVGEPPVVSPLGPLEEELQDDLVAQEIDSLREQRPGMVQRDDQVVLIYETLLAAFASAAGVKDPADLDRGRVEGA